MKIKWEVDDGYAGKSRPHFFEIDDEELEEVPEDERDDYIDDCVKEEFENKITFHWKVVD